MHQINELVCRKISKENIIKDYGLFLSLSKIADKYNISRWSVKNVLMKNNIPIRKEADKPV